MGDERVKTEVLQTINLFQVLPKLVVFDLDYTIWPFYCECHSKREMPSLYPHVKGILYALKDKGIDVAIASRSPTPDIAKTFLDKLGIQSMFVAQINNMGATSILVENGVNQQAFRQGLVEFSQKSKASEKAGSSGKNKKK
uniref:Magnesium-dependent phosphatase 1 n=1 Tax=Chenopodium quinoa TaxID=63459 RepID=A0A803MCB8_CHEQI